MSDVNNKDPVSKDEFNQSKKEFSEIASKLNHLLWTIVVVLMLGFIAILVSMTGIVLDTFRSKEASYQGLLEKVSDQNTKIDLLLKSNQDLQISRRVYIK